MKPNIFLVGIWNIFQILERKVINWTKSWIKFKNTFINYTRSIDGDLIMEDSILKEVRWNRMELENENLNDFDQIFNKHRLLHSKFKSRIVNKGDLKNSDKIFTNK